MAAKREAEPPAVKEGEPDRRYRPPGNLVTSCGHKKWDSVNHL
ncbi:hypothetical protein ABR737_29165 [Streptomyces sp. Edi2]